MDEKLAARKLRDAESAAKRFPNHKWDAASIRRDASDAQIIAAHFPNMSKSARAANPLFSACGDQPTATPVNRGGSGELPVIMIPKGTTHVISGEVKFGHKTIVNPRAAKLIQIPQFSITLQGQVRGGKNAMGVTQKGRHYARPAFSVWRSNMVPQIKAQLPDSFTCFTQPTNIRVDYFTGDKKRRDMTGILDALFHLLEYCGVVADDSLLWVTQSSRSYDKANPRVVITFLKS